MLEAATAANWQPSSFVGLVGPQRLQVDLMGARVKVLPLSRDRYTPSSYAAPSTMLPVSVVARFIQCGWRPSMAAAGGGGRRRSTVVAARARVSNGPSIVGLVGLLRGGRRGVHWFSS